MGQPRTAVLVGAGNRGYEAYGSYALAHPDEIRFVAVAEPHPARQQRFAQAHHIPTEMQFPSWEALFAKSQIADAAVICTQDRMHTAPATAALQAGYDVLLEKPMAATHQDCTHLVRLAGHNERLLQICHVLRYTPFFSTIHEIVTSGRLGEIVTMAHRENVSYWHMAHSYVRGNWGNSSQASPMILAKCCHDLDLLIWNLGPCRRLSSVGSLRHYRPENAPPGAPKHCTDGCPAADECPWYAPRLYLDMVPLLHVAQHSTQTGMRWGARTALTMPKLATTLKNFVPGAAQMLDYRGWPISVISEDHSRHARQEALEKGPYGRCVYHCDNDVVDHQVVMMEMQNGASGTLTMHGHAHREGRTMRYDGTRATLRARFYPNAQEIEIHDHLTGRVEVIKPTLDDLGGTGHGGGDAGLMAAFVQALNKHSTALTTANESLESHLIAFAAEQARLEHRVIDMTNLRSAFNSEPFMPQNAKRPNPQ